MGEYSPNDNYRILDGQNPRVNTSNADFRTALRNKGYSLSDYANYNSVVMLALVKYADLNFQYCLGMGWNGRHISSGDAILGDDGYNGSTRNDNASIKVMGIVDLYGNVCKNCDATFQYDGYVYVNDDLDNITEWPTMDTWKAMGYKKSNIILVLSRHTEYLKEFVNDSQFPWMTYPTNTGGDGTNPIGDYCRGHNDPAMFCIVLSGGSAPDDRVIGPFYWDSACNLLHADTNIGCLATAFPSV